MTAMDPRCKVIRPVTVDSTKLTSTNATDSTAEYSSATTYADGDLVKVTGTAGGAASATYKIYESQLGSNQGNDPTIDSGTNWVEVSSVNEYKMWDSVPQDQTSRADSLTVVVTPGEAINAIAFINTVATSVQITITSAVGGGTVYSATQSLIDTTMVGDWYDYFFEPIRRYGDFAITGLPQYSDCVITLTFTETGGNVLVGACVLGQFAELGTLEHGSQFGLTDYSTTSVDANGRFTITPGNYSKRWSVTVACETRLWSGVQGIFFDLRNTPVVWIGDEDVPGSIVYGYYREFQINVTNPALTMISLQVQGLTAT